MPTPRRAADGERSTGDTNEQTRLQRLQRSASREFGAGQVLSRWAHRSHESHHSSMTVFRWRLRVHRTVSLVCQKLPSVRLASSSRARNTVDAPDTTQDSPPLALVTAALQMSLVAQGSSLIDPSCAARLIKNSLENWSGEQGGMSRTMHHARMRRQTDTAANWRVVASEKRLHQAGRKGVLVWDPLRAHRVASRRTRCKVRAEKAVTRL